MSDADESDSQDDLNIDDDHNNKNRTLNCADEYIYTLVVFTNRGKPKKQLEIDIVPKKWIFFDEEKKRLMVRYLKPKGKTYTEDQCTLIQDMVEKNIDVPESEETWPSVFFKPKGRAKTYNEAKVKLDFLSNNENALTDSDEVSFEKSLIEEIKRKQLFEKLKKTKAALGIDLKRKSNNVSQKVNKIPKTVDHDGTEFTDDQLPVNNLPSIPTKDFQNSDLNNIHNKEGGRSSSLTNREEGKNKIIDSSKYVPSNDFESYVYHSLEEIKSKYSDLRKEVNNIGNNSNFVVTDHFHQNNLLKKFGIVIPLNSIHDFTSFCTRLSEEQPLRQEVVSLLLPCIDDQSIISKSIVKILRKFLSVELANKCNAHKEAEGKIVMFDTYFFNMVKALISENRKDNNQLTSTDELKKALRQVLGNTHKWKNKNE